MHTKNQYFFMQIKWGVYGALGWYFITQVGIIEAMGLAL